MEFVGGSAPPAAAAFNLGLCGVAFLATALCWLLRVEPLLIYFKQSIIESIDVRVCLYKLATFSPHFGSEFGLLYQAFQFLCYGVCVLFRTKNPETPSLNHLRYTRVVGTYYRQSLRECLHL
jgi:hypothetical protein